MLSGNQNLSKSARAKMSATTVFTLLLLYMCQPAASAQQPPNIVFVLADDMGYADIGYHGGGGQIKTPVLDRLAKEGVKLENYYVQPVCTPTRGTLMSGRLPVVTGLQHMVITPPAPYGLPLKYTTLPQQLKKQGYSTHMIGKWHLGMYKKEHLPVNRGFDSYYGYYQGAEDYFNHTVCYQQRGSKSYCGLDLHNNTTPDFKKTGQYSTHIFTREAIRILNQQTKQKSPMFMYLAYQNVHAPQQAPESYKTQYNFIKNEARRTLAAQTTILDEAVGNITEALKANGQWNNTVFIFSSDNGGPAVNIGKFGGVGCNYPLRGSKASVWEGGTKVAGFISGPLAPKSGSVYKGMMHISDWYPTIMALAGMKPPQNITLDGFNQWPAISGLSASPRTEILYNIDPLMPKYGLKKRNSPFDNRMMAALRMGDYKIVTGLPMFPGWYKPITLSGEDMRVNATTEYKLEQQTIHASPEVLLQNIYLFNITGDPYERNELSSIKPEVVDMMLVRLSEYYRGSVPPLNPQPQIDQADPSKHGGSWEPWQ